MSLYSRRLLRVLGLLVLSVIFLTLIRGLMLCWNFSQFSHQSSALLASAFVNGLRFDIAASVWLISPIFLLSLIPWPAGAGAEKIWRIVAYTFFVITQTFFLALNLIDVELTNIVGRRMTADVLFLLEEAQGKISGYWMTYSGLMLMAIAIMAVQILLAWFVLKWMPKKPIWAPSGRAVRAVFAFVALVLLIIGSRGGLQKKPISFVDANVFTEPLLNNIVLNTSFNVLKSMGQEKLPRVHYFDDHAELLRNLNGGITGPSLLEGHRAPGHPNVVILILESFDRSFMGRPVNDRQGWTPFLDSLAAKSLFFKNGFGNGRRSIEGVAAVVSGIPAMMDEPFITSPFAANKFVGLGTALGRENYHTSFFHGGNNGTMHFDSFMKSVGIQDYFGAREFPDPKDNDGIWGIYDGPFMSWMEGKINEMKQPFAVSFFSISSHQPYLIPPDVAGKYADTPGIPILKTVLYTDDSLREFFEAASKQPWYDNTLFVITADHASVQVDPSANNEVNRFRIPILFFHPKFQWPEGIDRDQAVQQIDILPSVLDFLGLPMKETIPLARSVFIPGEKSVTLFEDGNYLLVEKDLFISQRRGDEPRMYALTDTAEKTQLTEPADRRKSLIDRLKASIQAFSEGMWENKLYQ